MEGNNSNLYGLTTEERNTLAVLAQHVGRDNPITSRELRANLLKNDRESRPDTRRLVRDVMHKTGVPIGASNKGYYIIKDTKDLDEYIGRLQETVRGTEARIIDVSKAFFMGDTSADDMLLVDAIIEELENELMG